MDDCRKAFEARLTPKLDLKRGKDGEGYCYKVAELAFRDFADGWHAAQRSVAQELDALRTFKGYVHKRLNDAGVPTHPDGEHSKLGCRVGDRLDIALARWEHRNADADRDTREKLLVLRERVIAHKDSRYDMNLVDLLGILIKERER